MDRSERNKSSHQLLIASNYPIDPTGRQWKLGLIVNNKVSRSIDVVPTSHPSDVIAMESPDDLR